MVYCKRYKKTSSDNLDQEYFYFTDIEVRSLDSARTFCEMYNGTLVTMETKQKMNDVLSLLSVTSFNGKCHKE